MKLKTSTVIWVFLWSIFMGITVGSIGLGAMFPKLELLTGPVVCPRGKLDLKTQEYNPSPVETVTTFTWYCVDNTTGARQEVNMWSMALTAGPIYGLLLFGVILLWMVWRARRLGPSSESAGLTELARGKRGRASDTWDDPELKELVQLDAQERRSGKRTNVDDRLAELKRLRDSGLITAQDYDRKKGDILSEL